jgi:general secretion pathway protein A
MYNSYFGFSEKPFTIAPNPHFLFMSKRHQEALAHMLYGLQGEGGMMVLTGEVGTGKTTICRSLLKQLPENTNVAYIINPKQSANEMLASLCDELHITYADNLSTKTLTDALNQYLLDVHAKGQHTVLIIDEAQNLETPVLEQLRLLTNLETNDKKLLQIMLLGQPELSDTLQRKDLRQLAQRITSRYHLTALNKDELVSYVHHRLSIAGVSNQNLFPKPVLDLLFEYSGGIPRLINLIADRALLGTYASENKQVDKAILQQARNEVLGETALTTASTTRQSALPYILLLVAATVLLWVWNASNTPLNTNMIVAQPSLHVQTIPKPTLKIKEEGKSKTSQENTLVTKTPEVTDGKAIQTAKQQHILSTTNVNQAFVPLFQAWDIIYNPVADGDACTFAQQHQLRCLRQLGDIADMRSLDKPAALSISNEEGLKAYATVLKLAGTTATLASEDIYAEVPLSRLALFSHNDFTLLWKAPKGYDAPVRPSHSGALVATLAEQVTQALHQSWIGAPRTEYDDTLKEQVKTLQRQEGLSPDGVAGPLTWIHINALNHLGSPSLHTTKESN